MGRKQFSPDSPTIRPLMIFIDGGYLREEIREKTETQEVNEIIDYSSLSQQLLERTSDLLSKYIMPDLIRVFYYDATVDPQHDEYDSLKSKFEKIEETKNYQVKLGRIVEGRKKKQKGVDTRLSIDMISKAFLDHYELALLLAGDQDFLPLIKAVKDRSGKRVIGAYFTRSISLDLKRNLDYKIELDDQFVETVVEMPEAESE